MRSDVSFMTPQASATRRSPAVRCITDADRRTPISQALSE
jgi:hypothetical protein